jgi:hypothetical protein
MENRIWIIAPCFYDVPSFLELKKHAQSVLGAAYPKADIINVLVDDTGGQDTAIGALAREERLVIVQPPFNLGHQGALVFALRRLSTFFNDDDLVITIDSDGEDNPADLPALLAPLLTAPDNLTLVSLAQRTKRKRSGIFNTMYFFFRIFFVTLTGKVVHNGNFMAYRGWFAKNVLFHPFFDYCYSSAVLALSKSITFIPLARENRYFGESKMTLISLISHGFRMLLPFSDRIAVRGVVASTVLFLFSAAAGAYSIYLMYRASPHAIFAITLTLSAIGLLALIMATSALLFNIFNQTLAIALRDLTLHDGRLNCVKLNGLELTDLEAKSFHI